MSLPYFNMYPTDFEADTSHLSLEEDGAYNRLLRLIWMSPTCDLPDDDKWIMRRMRVSEQVFKEVVSLVIDEFFIRENGRLSNARMTKEFTLSNDAHKKRVEAGRKGGKNKSLKNKDIVSSNAKAKPKQPEPEPEPEPIEKEPKGSKKIDPSVKEILMTKVDEDRAKAIIEHRRKKRCALTQHTAKLLIKKLSQARDPNKAADTMLLRGWQSYDVGWGNQDNSAIKTIHENEMSFIPEVA